MTFYMFVHKLGADNLSSGEMVGALKFDKGLTSVTGSKKLIDNYKKILQSDAWFRAQRSVGNPFSMVFGASTVPRYIFAEGEEGNKTYSNFLKTSSSLDTEVVK
jgi:hypothetical protein